MCGFSWSIFFRLFYAKKVISFMSIRAYPVHILYHSQIGSDLKIVFFLFVAKVLSFWSFGILASFYSFFNRISFVHAMCSRYLSSLQNRKKQKSETSQEVEGWYSLVSAAAVDAVTTAVGVEVVTVVGVAALGHAAAVKVDSMFILLNNVPGDEKE